MARSLRCILPGVAVHIIQRGVNRTTCFRAEADYLVYLSNLRQLAAKYSCALHAYCLMSNHVHLLVTPGAVDSCAQLMRDLGRRYVPYFNRRHGRSGTLWEGRFRACLVESAHYVLACYRYIELNPVRAGMVSHAAGYLWSSYAVNSGARCDPSIAPHVEFRALSPDTGRRHAAYRALFEIDMDLPLVEAIRDATNGGYPLSSDRYRNTVLQPLGWKTRPGKPGPQPYTHPDPELGKRVATLTPN